MHLLWIDGKGYEENNMYLHTADHRLMFRENRCPFVSVQCSIDILQFTCRGLAAVLQLCSGS